MALHLLLHRHLELYFSLLNILLKHSCTLTWTVTAPSKLLRISHLPGHIALYLMILVHIEGSSWFWAGCCHQSFATNMACSANRI